VELKPYSQGNIVVRMVVECGDPRKGRFMKAPTVLLLCCLTAVFAQEPKAIPKRPPAKPALSESFAKAGLRALIAIEDYDGEGDPLSAEAEKKAYQEAQAEHDPEKPAEARMFSNLTLFNLLRSMNNLQKRANGLNTLMSEAEQVKAKEALHVRELKCFSELELAFRHRTTIELPASCNPPK
jgi:hypothetical protein